MLLAVGSGDLCRDRLTTPIGVARARLRLHPISSLRSGASVSGAATRAVTTHASAVGTSAADPAVVLNDRHRAVFDQASDRRGVPYANLHLGRIQAAHLEECKRSQRANQPMYHRCQGVSTAWASYAVRTEVIAAPGSSPAQTARQASPVPVRPRPPPHPSSTRSVAAASYASASSRAAARHRTGSPKSGQRTQCCGHGVDGGRSPVR